LFNISEKLRLVRKL